MVDNVIISGLEPNVPKWATEKTLGSLDTNIQKMVKILNDKTKGQDPKTIKSLNTEQEKLRKLLSENNAQYDTTNKKAKKEDAEGDKRKKKAADNLKKKMFDDAKSTGTIGKATGLFGDKIKGLLTPSTEIAMGFGLAAYEINNFAKYLEKTYTSFIDLYDTGITFQKGLLDFRLAATEAALPLSDFAELLQKNSAVVTTFGDGGARALGQISKSTIDLVHNQMQLGIGYKDINEYLGSYLETARLQGFLDKISNSERAVQGAQYIKELTLYSQVLGKSRQQIDKEVQAAARRPDINTVLSALPNDLAVNAKAAFTKTSEFISGSAGDASGALQEMFNTLITSFNPAESKTWLALNAANPEAAQAILQYTQSIKDGTMNTANVNSDMVNILKNLDKTDDFTLSTLIKSQSQWKEGAIGIGGILQNVKSINAQSLKDLAEGKVKTLSPIELALQRMSDIFRKVQANFEGVFSKFMIDNIGTFERLANNAADFAEKFAAELGKFLNFITDLFDPTTREKAIAGIKDMFETQIVPFLKDLTGKMLDFIGQYIVNGLREAVFGKTSVTKDSESFASKINAQIVKNTKDTEFRKNESRGEYIGATNTILGKPNNMTPISGVQYNKNTNINNMMNQQLEQSMPIDKNDQLNKLNNTMQSLLDLHKDTNDKMSTMVNQNSTSNTLLSGVNRNIRTNSNIIK